jgi:hypothetical protein
MSAPWKGFRPASSVVYLEFASFAAATGASSATSSFVAGDVQIYKDGSTTQRSSSAGITATTSFDSNTGLNHIAIDLSDNTDAGFYAAGHHYQVAVADVTIDSQTVRFWVGSFDIGPAQVDVRQYGGTAGTFSSGIPEVKVNNIAANAITAASIASDADTEIANSVWDALTSAHTVSGSFGEQFYAIRSNTAQAGASTTITLDASAVATDSYYNQTIIVITGGTGAGQSRMISGYVGSTKVATVTTAWATNPDNTSTFVIIPFGEVRVASNSGNLTANLIQVNGHAVTDTASGVLDVNAKNHGGTAQTGRDIGASVLLSAGAGTGQLDFTAGVVKSNLAQILGTALTETAGQIAAAFKKLFDVSTPVLTAQSVNQTGDAYARLGAPAGASTAADIAAVKSDSAAIKTQTDKLAFTVSNKVDANVLAFNGDATAAANIAKTTRAIARGTVSGSPSTTSIPTSAFSPAGAAADQFKGRIITFDADTATTALRGQSTDITASSNSATPTLTVTALTTAPSSGDTFSVT